jgi:uncharacterized protein RhaS with RHS repeats
LQNNLNRWYDPAVGRWLSEDPIAADSNLYRYCVNGPTLGLDGAGLEATWETCCPQAFAAIEAQLAITASAMDILAADAESLGELARDLAFYERIWVKRNEINAGQTTWNDVLALLGWQSTVHVMTKAFAEAVDQASVERITQAVLRGARGRFAKHSADFAARAAAQARALSTLRAAPPVLINVGIVSNAVARIIDILSTANLASTLMDVQTKAENAAIANRLAWRSAMAYHGGLIETASRLSVRIWDPAHDPAECKIITAGLWKRAEVLAEWLKAIQNRHAALQSQVFGPAQRVLRQLENLSF